MDRWRRWAVVVIPPLGALALIIVRSNAPVMPMDEGMPVVYGDLVHRGFVPHRDFQSFYGPGMPWLIAAVDALLGPSVWSERLVATLVRLLTVAGVTVFARRWGDRIAIVAGLVSAVAFEVARPIYAYAAFPALTCSLWSVIIASRASDRRQAIVAGLLGSAALVFRPDYVLVAWPPALLAFVIWRPGMFAAYAGGLLAGLLPLGVQAVIATPSALFENLVVDGPAAAQQRTEPIFDRPGEVVVLTFIALAALWATWRGLRRMRSARRRDAELASYAMLTFLLLPQAVRLFEPIHISIATGIGLPLVVIVFAQLAAQRHVGVRARTTAVVGGVVFYAISFVGLSAPPPSLPVTRGDRSYPETLVAAPELNAIVAASAAYVRPGMRLFVGPADLTHPSYSDTILYFLYPDLVPASYFLEMNPQTSDREGSRLADDIASADVLILTTRWDHLYESSTSSSVGSYEPGRVIAERFRVVDTEGSYALYVRK